MLGKVQVGTIAVKTLSAGIDPKNVFIELKLDNILFRTNSLALFLPQWYVFETIEEKLHTQHLHISLIDESNGRIAKAYLTLSSLILPRIINKQGCLDETASFREISGWIPLYDDHLSIISKVNITVKLENFLLLSPRVQFFFTTEPQGYYAKTVHGFVDESIIEDLQQYDQTDLESLFFNVSGELQNKLKLKLFNFGANAVLGYKQSFEWGKKGVIVIRGRGTAVTLVRDVETDRKFGDYSETSCMNTYSSSSQSIPPPNLSTKICNTVANECNYNIEDHPNNPSEQININDDNYSKTVRHEYSGIRELEEVTLAMAVKHMSMGNKAVKKNITSSNEDSTPSNCNLAISRENCNMENKESMITFNNNDKEGIDFEQNYTNEINYNPFKLLGSSNLEPAPNITNYDNSKYFHLSSNKDDILKSDDTSDALKNVHIEDDSLVKCAIQTMLLSKVGVVGTCTPHISSRECNNANSTSLKQQNYASNNFFPFTFSPVDGNRGSTNRIDNTIVTFEQEKGNSDLNKINLSNSSQRNTDISEVLRDIEVKEKSLVKTAMQTMLLAKVGVIGTCTPPVSPKTSDDQSSCQSQSRFFPPSFKGISINNIDEQNMDHIINQIVDEPTTSTISSVNSQVSADLNQYRVQKNPSAEKASISEALQGIEVDDQSLIKTAVQTMLLSKVGVIGTCTPPVSPKILDSEGNCSSQQDQGDTSKEHMRIDSSNQEQEHGLYITPEDVQIIQGIPDAIQKVEIKDGGLVKTAIQAMLLDKVSLVGTYTPPTSPSLRSSIDAQFAFPKKKINMPKSASHVNFADYIKKQKRETVLGVPFTSVANLKAEILKRQQSQPCFIDSNDLMPIAQTSSGIKRNGQNRMSDTQLDKPMVRSMLNESLEKKKNKFRCFHLKRKKLFSFLHKTQDSYTNEKKEHKSIISRIFHRKTKDAKSVPPFSDLFPDPNNISTNNNITCDPSDIFESVPIDTGTSSNITNSSIRNSAMQNAINFQNLTKNLTMDELSTNNLHRRSSDSDVSIRAGVSLIGVALGLENKQKEMNSSDTLDVDETKSENEDNVTGFSIYSKSPSNFNNLRSQNIPITTSPCIQNGIISMYLGNLNFFLMSPYKKEEKMSADNMHKIVIEIAAILRGHIIAMGGNALVSLFMEGIPTEGDSKGNFVINVGGDVVSYIAADT